MPLEYGLCLEDSLTNKMKGVIEFLTCKLIYSRDHLSVYMFFEALLSIGDIRVWCFNAGSELFHQS